MTSAKGGTKPVRARGADVVLAAVIGLASGLVLAVVAGAGVALRGSEALSRLGYSLPELVAMYIVCGVVFGALVGLLLPAARRGNTGSAVVGMLIGALAYNAFALPTETIREWAANAPWYSVFGMLAGGIAGPIVRRHLGDIVRRDV